MTPLILSLALAAGAPDRGPVVDVGDIALPAPDQRLTAAELKDRSFVELAILRNHYFARHGRTFTKPWIQAFFDKQPWYTRREFKESDLSATDRANVATISKAETAVTPAELRVRRNTVFARHGRVFKSDDLKKHFAAQPWYRPDPKFSLDRLTARDTLEVQLIQEMEAAAAAVQGLDKWQPGRKLARKTLQEASEWDLASFAGRVVRTLKLKGFGEVCDGPIFMINLEEDECEGWKAFTRDPRKLPRVDRETWRRLERRLAELAVTLDHPHFEDCYFECEGNKDEDACVSRCEQRQAKEEKAHEAAQKKKLAAVKKGQHAHNGQLLKQLMSVLAASAA